MEVGASDLERWEVGKWVAATEAMVATVAGVLAAGEWEEARWAATEAVLPSGPVVAQCHSLCPFPAHYHFQHLALVLN